MTEIKKILFPCDLTEDSSRILPYILSLSEKYNSLIYLLYVEDLRLWGGHFIPHPHLGVLQKETLSATQKTVDKICAKHLEGYPNVQKRIVCGDPSSEIVKTIESEGIDLVVMGTHGRKGFEHTIFGSVAEQVVQKSPVPVLVMNPYNLQPVHAYEWRHPKQRWDDSPILHGAL
jgi:nucleotide-binding universal stress UspA family protein